MREQAGFAAKSALIHERETRRRVLAVRMDTTNWRLSFSKTSGLYGALEERVDLVDVMSPPGRLVERVVPALVRRSAMMARISAGLGLEHRLLGQRAQAVEGLLETKAGTYDVVLADETLAFVPPGLRYDRRYVIYTDNTFALSRQLYPQWLGPSVRENDRLEAYERKVFRSAHAVCCMSEFAAQSAIGDYGCERKRVRIVGGGTSFVPLDATHRLPQPTALFVGRDFEVKGGSTLLAAWENVQAQLPDAQLWIVGPPARRSTASITWFGRISDRGTLRNLFSQASVFAIPSRFEAFGIACIEAMMHGLPVVATRCCAFPELISDGETGILVEVGSSDQLAEALCVLLSDLPSSRAMGLKAHAAVANSMTWNHVADRMMPALS